MMQRLRSRVLPAAAVFGGTYALSCTLATGLPMPGTLSATPTKVANCAATSQVGMQEARSRMQLYGHRGASALRPENTRAAFQLALERGAAGVECDLQRLKDSIIVLHDETLARTARHHDKALLDVPVEKLLQADVQGIDVGSWLSADYAGERLLTLDQFLALIASKDGKCLVEVKGGDFEIISGILKAARASPLSAQQLTFIGFDIDLMRAIKVAGPEYPCFGVAYVEPVPVVDRFLGIAERRALSFVQRCAEAGLDGADFNADVRVVTPRVVKELHGKGMQCAVWAFKAPASNDTPTIWAAMEEIGVDVFTSNCPAEAFDWWDKLKDRT